MAISELLLSPAMEAIPAALPAGTFETVAEALAVLRPIMHGIAAAVGAHCEVVLHDLTSGDLGHTIVAIENGHVTGRAVGGPSTNLGIDLLNDESADHNAFGYRGRTTDGRELHSSSIYYRNAAGHIIAALCINVDLTPMQVALSAVGAMLPSASPDTPEIEIAAPDISSILDEMIGESVAATGKAVPLMEKADRVEILRQLDARGAFRVRRALDQVATRLGISRVTAYGYLDEIRRDS